MINKRYYAIAVLFVSFHVNASSWIYRGYIPSDEEHVLVIESSNKISLNHREFTWFSCEDASYICLMSGLISFSIPRIPGEKSKWTKNKVDYTVETTKMLKVFGQTIPDVMLIKASFQQDDKYVQEFLFSYERGLLAISEKARESKSFLLLEGICGYGALSTCSE